MALQHVFSILMALKDNLVRQAHHIFNLCNTFYPGHPSADLSPAAFLNSKSLECVFFCLNPYAIEGNSGSPLTSRGKRSGTSEEA